MTPPAHGVLRTRRAIQSAPARKGDLLAARVVEEIGRRIALGVAAVAAVLDLDLVILGGGIGANNAMLLDPIGRELRALSPLRPRLAISALGDDAVLWGAVATALSAAQERLFDPARMLDRQDQAV